jgi:hypoxanthine phosphoribosyltransferase
MGGLQMTHPPSAWDPRLDLEEILFDTEAIADRVAKLAAEITEAYLPNWQEDPSWSLTVVSVLRGGVFFVTDLTRALGLPLTLDFMAVSAYGSSGRVRILKDLEEDIENKDVLVVEDIIDTGLTLRYLLSQLRARQPRTLAVATLIDRPAVRLVQDLPLTYIGFAVPEAFVVGYGLDYRERYRNLPYIGVLRPEVMAQTTEKPRFAHPSEEEVTRLLDFYRIRWEYEPTTFVLKTDETGQVEAAFRPDFYLPDFDLYIELTTKKPHLMNRKLRQMEAVRAQYPDVHIELLDRADFDILAQKLNAKGSTR